MKGHFNPGQGFDQEFFDRLEKCFKKDGDNLLMPSQNNSWKGILDYWDNNGKETYDGKRDVWDIINPGREGNNHKYIRSDPDTFGNIDMTVQEPCNYVSNVAFYHATVELCEYDYQTFNTY